MSGGEWLIRQHPPSGHGGYLTERVTIEDTASGTEPLVSENCDRIMFTYADGRIVAYSWQSIIRAEYRPHPEP